MLPRINPEHKAIVEAGGGRYVAETNLPADSVLFTSHQTGSTLCLPAKGLTPDAVRDSIATSNAKFPPQQWRVNVRRGTTA